MACKFGFPMVAAERLDNCADMAMDWLTKDQALLESGGGRNESDYWRNQWQLHKAMLARIEGRKGHLFMSNTAGSSARLQLLHDSFDDRDDEDDDREPREEFMVDEYCRDCGAPSHAIDNGLCPMCFELTGGVGHGRRPV